MRTKNIIMYLFLLLLLLVSIQVISATNTSNTSNDTNIAQPPGQEKQNITATYSGTPLKNTQITIKINTRTYNT